MITLIFDAGPVISLTMNNLTWLLEELKKSCQCAFYIPESIKYELIDRPIEGRRFKFEAMQTLVYLKNHVLEVYKGRIKQETNQLADLMNHLFNAKGKDIQLVHLGEVETVAVALKLNAEAIVADERTIRLLIEDPLALHRIMEGKLHTRIDINKKVLSELQSKFRNLKVIRSIELVTVAYEKGLLDKYLPYDLPNSKKELLTAALWAMKLSGCSVSQQEINDIISIEGL
jgi:predicted nucleic acid-binding protein